jgi:Mrp family chromosome partitioning ATPase
MEPAGGIFATEWFHRSFILAPDGEYSTVTELAGWARAPYDEIRKSLLQRSNGERELPRVLLVAAARHGDGATTTALMLAANLASDRRCIVLELNFRRPGLGHAIGAPEVGGLNGVLHETNGFEGLEHAIVGTPLANLYALPSGMNGSNGNGRRLPDARRAGELVRWLLGRFDHVVIDTAPVTGYPDTALLASVADGVILTVAADATPLEVSLAAKRELERSGASILGAVITRQRQFVPRFIARRLSEV